jgi:hypothetical protein
MHGGKSAYLTYIIVFSGACLYICDLCNVIFTDMCYLVAYQSTHSAEFPCRCDVCNSASSVQVHLKLHLHLHSD